jgi:hypothetical protein
MSIALELLGDSTALDTLQVARRLAVDNDDRIRLAAQEVWLRVKFGIPSNLAGLVAARELADSLLLQSKPSQVATLDLLPALAVLTGRADLAATLARQATSAREHVAHLDLPVRTIASSQALLIYSALGGPVDSLVALERMIAQDVRGAVIASQYTATLNTLFGQAAGLAYPVHRFESMAALTGRGNPLVDAQAALAAGDSIGARRALDAFKARRTRLRPADLTLDITYPAAWTLAALGDPREAIDWLEPVLNAAQGYPPKVVSTTANAGALVRGLLLRAQLAEQAGDMVTARKWRSPAEILWKNADPAIRQQLQPKR